MDDHKFNLDRPIEGGAYCGDLLDRKEFSSKVASVLTLRSGSPGLVLSIEGPWGYGKTSVINMISHQLTAQTDNPPIVVHFNPWMVGSASALVQEFLLQIASTVGLLSKSDRANRLSQALVSYSRLFSFLKLVPGAGVYAEVIEKVLKGGSEAAAAASELAQISMTDRKNRVSQAIIELGKSIVVFLDDLDRLPPSEVFEMIRLVKAISDFPQVSYVLAFDPAYVENALEKAMISDGRSYLDKIIQVRLSLPRISLGQIGRIVDQELGAFVSEEALQTFPGEGDRITDLYHYAIKFLLRTPRDVYRTCNRLRIVHPATREEIGFADLFALESIAITAPPLYEHIRLRPQAYVGPLEEDSNFFKEAKEVIEGFKVEREAALRACRQDLGSALLDLVGRLFPLTADGPGFDEARASRVSGRISNPDNLLIALSGGLPLAEVSLLLVREFVEEPERRHEIAAEISNVDKIEDFLDFVSAFIRRQREVSDPEGLIEILSKISESDVVNQFNERYAKGFLKPPLSSYFLWVLRDLLATLKPEESTQLISSLCADPGKLALSTELIYFACGQQGVFSQNPGELENHWLVSGEDLKMLTNEWIKSTLEVLFDGSAFKSKWVGQALYLLRHLDLQALRDVVAANLLSTEKADCLMRALGSGSRDSTKGFYASFPESFLNELGDAEQLRGLARERLKDPCLPPDLRAIYTSISLGTKEYFVDYESTGGTA